MLNAKRWSIAGQHKTKARRHPMDEARKYVIGIIAGILVAEAPEKRLEHLSDTRDRLVRHNSTDGIRATKLPMKRYKTDSYIRTDDPEYLSLRRFSKPKPAVFP